MTYYISSPDSTTSGSFYDNGMSYVSASKPLSSPPFSQAKLRYEASKGFDVEDDVLFCPALSEHNIPALNPINRQDDDTPIIERRKTNPLEIINPATGLPIGRR